MKYKAIYFDFDGTLMDTSIGIFAGARYAMEKLGLPIALETKWNLFIGPPIGDCFRIVFGIKEDAVVNELVRQYRIFYHATGRFQANFYPGMVSTLEELKKQGYKLAVATMKNQDLAIEMCDFFKISYLFDDILGLNLAGTNSKADLLKVGFERLGISPKDSVLVGDTTIDQEGAKQAGCDFIGVNWGFGFTLEDSGTIDSPYQILNFV